MTTEVPATMCVIGIGSNTPDRDERMALALAWLSKAFDCAAISPVYETPEWSGRFPSYINAVAALSLYFDDTLEEVKYRLKQYEIKAGRTPNDSAAGLVPIDLDIVIWRGDVCRPVDYDRDYFRIGFDRIASRIVTQES